jgi:putative ABC transport system permease protein
VIGARIARELFAERNPLGETIRIGGSSYRVIGVIAPRGTSIGMNMDEVVYIPVKSAMRLFDRRSLFRLLIEVRSHEGMDSARESALSILKDRHGGEEDVTALTQDSVLATFGKILRILTAALAGIAAISLTVAGLGIMNVMLVSVSERTREIGLLKAIGVSERQILGVFLLEGAILSSMGGLLGLALAFAGGRAFQALIADFPVRPPLWAVLAALGVSIGVGLAFGSLPARKAARLDPVAALMRRRA